MSEQHEQIKFNINETYELKLSFDEPQIFAGGKFGTSRMYGATHGSKEIRFYASEGLHGEIQNQGLKRSSKCVIKKTRDNNIGDFDFFLVNGVNSKYHPKKDSDNQTETITPTTTSAVDVAMNVKIERIEESIKVLTEQVKHLFTKIDEEIPF